MKVFVAGATGVLGRALLPSLVALGHEVYGTGRTPEKVLAVAQMGATPVRADVLDAERIARAVGDVQPDAIVNLATSIPLKLRVNLDHWKENDRVRLEGSRNLLAAARNPNLRLFVQASADQVCDTQGDGWITEQSPRSSHAFLHATQEMEDRVRASGLPATLLRFSVLMAADSWHTQQSVTALKRGLLPVIGDGGAFVSMVHVADAVQAILLALQKPELAAGQTFNVADNEPARMRDILPYAAQLLHAQPPRTVPPLMAKMVVGALTIDVLTQSHRMSNEKIRNTLGFAPQFPTYRESWTQIVREIGASDFAASDDLK